MYVRRIRLILPAGSILGLSHAVERSLLSIPLGPANTILVVMNYSGSTNTRVKSRRSFKEKKTILATNYFLDPEF